jgi:Na+/H+ antiporter
MENYSIVIFLLAIMIGLCALGDRINISYPVLLITAGIAIGFIPSMPVIEINPEVIFLIFLPPLLYDAAFNISFPSFRSHLNTISTLSIGLVFITASGIAVIAHYMLDMSWPLSFVLGSILAATDAVAAITITRDLKLPHNVATILEGESLINDASALVAYRFAVAAVTGTAFVLWKASLQFLLLMAGGALVGLVMGNTLVFILRHTRHNKLATLGFTLLMPFVTYLIAEEFHVSGVIAVVMLGIGISRFSDKLFAAELKQESKTIWDIIIFLLNGLIFILIGLEFPNVAKQINPDDILPYIGYAFIITIAALVLRTVRVLLQKFNLQRAFRSSKGRVKEDALLTLQESIIISWSGMRGIVSLAIAIGLPVTLENGNPFPHRNTIIFISTVVVLFTIIGQGLTLPWIVRKMRKHSTHS